jgi:hypothetical protein
MAKKQKSGYVGLEPIKIIGEQDDSGWVWVKYMSDVFNDSGTIVYYKGNKTLIQVSSITDSPVATKR